MSTFDPTKHPRHPAGSSKGGEFSPALTAALGKMMPDQLPPNLRTEYDRENAARYGANLYMQLPSRAQLLDKAHRDVAASIKIGNKQQTAYYQGRLRDIMSAPAGSFGGDNNGTPTRGITRAPQITKATKAWDWKDSGPIGPGGNGATPRRSSTGVIIKPKGK